MHAAVLNRTEVKNRLDIGIRYLAAAVIVAAAGLIYEMFSHGVYSAFMAYAFMVPLLGGALPAFLMARRSLQTNKKRAVSGHSSAAGPSRTHSASLLQLAAVVTLTAGSLIKGVLDIYGTTNRLIMVYPVIGAAFAIAAVAVYLITYASSSEEPAASATR